MFAFQGGGEIIMEQTASKERAMSSFTKRKGQTTYRGEPKVAGREREGSKHLQRSRDKDRGR